MHPAVFETCLPVQRQRSRWCIGCLEENSEPHHDLKTVADTQYQPIG